MSRDNSRNAFDIESILGQVGGFAAFPTAILGTVPFFSQIREPLQRHYGIDVGQYLIGLYVSVAVFFSLKRIWKGFWPWLARHLTSSISIQVGTPAYEDVLNWVTDNVIDRRSLWANGARSLVISTGRRHGDDTDAVNGGEFEVTNEQTSLPTRFKPGFVESCWIPHVLPWRNIHFHRQKPDMQYVQGEERKQDVSFITLSCLGASTQPLKYFVKKCRDNSVASAQGQTFLWRNEGEYWQREPVTRLNRPVDTVDIDHKERKDLVDDVSYYLRPETRRFYARRGIPYRRGLLFHGPPGTGKTSMSLALAGHFNLGLFIINLAEFEKGDSGLSRLFGRLPDKCLVLLEDIDSAGIGREKVIFRRHVRETSRGADDKVKIDGKDPKQQSLKAVTLSGLLNAIDGVAAKEGRVTVMTSNNPDALDDALIRPGRVDRRVFFGPVKRHMAKAIFKRMYTKDADDFEDPKQMLKDHFKEAGSLSEDIAAINFRQKFAEVFNDAEHLERLAEKFANHVPEDKFTPAEIQGFLLGNMESPSQAVAKVSDWVTEMTGQKEAGIETTAGHASDRRRSPSANNHDPTDPHDPALWRYYSPKGSPSSSEERKKQSDLVKEYMQRVSREPTPEEEEKAKSSDRDTAQSLGFVSGNGSNGSNGSDIKRAEVEHEAEVKRDESKLSPDITEGPAISIKEISNTEKKEEIAEKKSGTSLATAAAEGTAQSGPKAENEKPKKLSRRQKRRAREKAQREEQERLAKERDENPTSNIIDTVKDSTSAGQPSTGG